jgi:hypothetical protein
MNQTTDYPRLLTPDQVVTFQRDGLLLLKSCYDKPREIEPIQYAIYRLVGLLIEKYHLPIERGPFTPASFDSGFQELIAHDRRYGAEIYDAVKHVPAFVRLASHPHHDAIMAQLRGTDLPGITTTGYGIRIDHPGEERFRADWHQEYPAQLRSLDGLVFWSPLVEITEPMGPVRFCVGSHRDGLVRVRTQDPEHPEKTGAYGLILEDRDARVARYPQIAPLTAPGDLVVVDFLTLHASGHNTSRRSRWSMQIRYFNYLDPTGIRISWRGSYGAGVDFTKIHPDLVVD